MLVPTLGGVLAGAVLWLLSNKRAPFGISDIIGLVALRRGTIRIRDSLVQIVSSACTIGSGGSIGKEGANSQLAATFAAALGRAFRVNSRTRAMLLGCGIAAGMATSYNAPIASAIFVMEAVLGNFAMDVFAPIVVSSVLATILRRALLDERAIYGGGLPQDLGVLSWHLVLAALLLGVFCGFGGILFRRLLKSGRQAFLALKLSPPLLLGLGGLFVGAMGLFVPEVWGNGFDVIANIVDGTNPAPLTMVLSLFVWKLAATVTTIGSGGLGGIFTPNLVVGAAFGAFFAHGLEWIAPNASEELARHEQITFAFVGMAGLCAAVTHAPVTAVVLVFELTGHYELVLPIMLCTMPLSLYAMTPGVKLTPMLSAIPISGLSMILQNLLSVSGEPISALSWCLGIGSLLGCVLLALIWASWQFRRESVLFRGESGLTIRGWWKVLMSQADEQDALTLKKSND